MPLINGNFVAPRKAVQKQRNGALVAVWLAFRLIAAELNSAGGNWDAVISTFRVLLGEPVAQRMDFHEDGARVTYADMADFIRDKREDWGAK